MNRQWPDDGAENALWHPDVSATEASGPTPVDNVVAAFKWYADLAPRTSQVSVVELFPDGPPSEFERRSFSRKLSVFLGILHDIEDMGEYEEYFRRILLLAWIRRFARVCNSTVPWNTQEISSRLESMGWYREHYSSTDKPQVWDRYLFAGFIIAQFALALEQSHNIGLLNYIAFDLIDDWLYRHSYWSGGFIQSQKERRYSPVGLRIQRL